MSPFDEIAVIGDITVDASDDFVRVLVDGDVALFMSRDPDKGLLDLINALQSVVR